MHDTSNLPVILILLATAVVIVALFRKLRVSPVLGYLVAGMAIGPTGAGIITDTSGTAAAAEFGIAFLLFIIGLELSWERLHAMRRYVFIVGIAQVVLTTGVLAAGIYVAGFPVATAVIIAGGLAFSSTAFVLQLITEYNQKASQLGRLSLAVLLVQDIAVIPLLVIVPTLAHNQPLPATDIILIIIKAVAVLALILFAGRLLLRPLYRLIASLANPELFTALTLLVVLGTGWLTSMAGLSLALGAFMAGILMAETEYRHQVEADVMPYKGLLLGLFFMTVGMSTDVRVLWEHFSSVLMLASGLMAVKALIIIGLCRAFGFGVATSMQAGLLLAQGGEFAFIVFGQAVGQLFIGTHLAQILTAVVTVSMALTPFAAALARSTPMACNTSRCEPSP